MELLLRSVLRLEIQVRHQEIEVQRLAITAGNPGDQFVLGFAGEFGNRPLLASATANDIFAALLDISLLVPPGAIVAVVGANGAGKSTLLRAISGVARDAEGSIMFGERVLLRRGLGLGKLSVRHLRSDEIVRAGIVHVPEGRQIFQNLTVKENLKLGAFTRRDNEVEADLERALSASAVVSAANPTRMRRPDRCAVSRPSSARMSGVGSRSSVRWPSPRFSFCDFAAAGR